MVNAQAIYLQKRTKLKGQVKLRTFLILLVGMCMQTAWRCALIDHTVCQTVTEDCKVSHTKNLTLVRYIMIDRRTVTSDEFSPTLESYI